MPGRAPLLLSSFEGHFLRWPCQLWASGGRRARGRLAVTTASCAWPPITQRETKLSPSDLDGRSVKCVTADELRSAGLLIRSPDRRLCSEAVGPAVPEGAHPRVRSAPR